MGLKTARRDFDPSLGRSLIHEFGVVSMYLHQTSSGGLSTLIACRRYANSQGQRCAGTGPIEIGAKTRYAAEALDDTSSRGDENGSILAELDSPLPYELPHPMMEGGTGTRRPGVWKPLQTEPCALWRTKIPYGFAVGEPATNVQAPKAKGHRNRAV